jgi:hypothetical protein
LSGGALSEAADEKAHFHLSRQSKRTIYSATITAVVCVLTIGQAHAGFFFCCWCCPWGHDGWSATSSSVGPTHGWHIFALFIWALALGLIVAAHFLRHEMTRRDADRIALAIDRHVQNQGYCATSLAELGFKPDDVEERLGSNYKYACVERKPRFSYVATFTVFDTWDYDFVRDRWKYSSWAAKKAYLNPDPPAARESVATPSASAPLPNSQSVPHRKP